MAGKFTRHKPSSVMKIKCQALQTPQGFTLIELMLAMVLYSTVLLILAPTLMGGLQVWKRNQDQESAALPHEVDLLLMKMSEELESAVPFSPVPFEGKENEMAIATVLPRLSLESGGRQFSKVRYWREGETLYREEEDLASSLQKRYVPKKGKHQKIWLEGVQRLSFQYAYRSPYTDREEKNQTEWHNDWRQKKDEATLPFAVKINLKWLNGSGQILEIEKDFFLPDGVRKPYHEIGG